MKHIQSAKNPQVKQWKKLLTKKEREKTHTYLIEGFHLVEEALNHKDEVVELIITEDTNLPTSWDLSNIPLTYISPEISREISDTETSQGVFALCEMKKANISSLENKKYLLLDAIRDPGNLGTMIRTADAAGIDAVILGKGTVDLYNSKALRSAQGSHFHLDILAGDLKEWIDRLKTAGTPVYGTALEGASSFKEAEPGQTFALLMGNEGNGVSKELLELTDQNLYIPIYGKSESLNVAIAAGILLYYLRA
ncbi:TrmH family RNA methyltransferase [Heyndrickxia acidicola]|uniref:RNA methyltransferase n=1 Tax=Heyndrickxia acidicola TaxID=209389 RepID=A0ABU6MK58_9BACI|nr:RNA methyltransferase [Heyndrickxia acidicola]MED1204864.1 RNA methyltransferase [Heyndrickxia acidicola]